MMALLFDRYDESDLLRRFDDTGMLTSLLSKGFSDFDVSIAASDPAFPHVILRARKRAETHVLLDACLRRLTLPAESLAELDTATLDLLLVHWVREEDPTSAFTAERPALPLQDHPGLGVLRRAFRVAVGLGRELGVDGIANEPKFFHDAVIFHRSRLFLFLDGNEQGRFEALIEDLAVLDLRTASLAVAAWCVRELPDTLLQWRSGLQVFPLSDRLIRYFNGEGYAARVRTARAACHFRIDEAALAVASRMLEERVLQE